MRAIAADVSAAFPGLKVSDDAADKVAYARDLWPRHHLAVRAGKVATHEPAAIVWPETTADVQALVKWARATKTALVPFGAGSGVCAGILPNENVVVVDLKKMNRWRALDREKSTLVVEAGEMGFPLEEKLNREGFTLGHFPSSIICSTVGGWVAARSAGQNSGYYGKIEDMVVSLECVTGAGEIVKLSRRSNGPDLVPLVVGSEGTMAIVTAAELRLHPVPTARGFGAWSFPSTEAGWEAMRELFQAGMRPAVCRLYDPFDAMLARRGAVKREKKAPSGHDASPGLGPAALRKALQSPETFNALLESSVGAKALGGSLLVVIYEGEGDGPQRDIEETQRMFAREHATYEGEGPARRWLQHRYSISYRQAPVIASGLFLDTMEVAASWSNLGALYDGVRRAMGERVFVMAHLSHAYADGCCIYFSFAGSAKSGVKKGEWDASCESVYDATWRSALDAAVASGGTLAHHHGVGRSKAPRLGPELGKGVDVVRSLQRAFDPDGILNPGALLPREKENVVPAPPADRPKVAIDRTSLLAEASGDATLGEVERAANVVGTTLGFAIENRSETVKDFVAKGAHGLVDPFVDPADHLLAGFEATLASGETLAVRPAPRRAVGPDLVALVFGAEGRVADVTRAWLRVHLRQARRPTTAPARFDRTPGYDDGEKTLIERAFAAAKTS
ncbi:MAG TPA: FAD-binding protein [Polyangiaceae bacterium]